MVPSFFRASDGHRMPMAGFRDGKPVPYDSMTQNHRQTLVGTRSARPQTYRYRHACIGRKGKKVGLAFPMLGKVVPKEPDELAI